MTVKDHLSTTLGTVAVTNFRVAHHVRDANASIVEPTPGRDRLDLAGHYLSTMARPLRLPGGHPGEPVSPSLLLVVTLPAHAACTPPTFTFLGQPACVTVDFAGDHTLLTSACDGPLLVDRSVTLGSPSVVLPGETATLRDLSTFTVGLDGELHWVVATVDPPTCEVAAAAPERADAAAAMPAAMLRIVAPVVAWVW